VSDFGEQPRRRGAASLWLLALAVVVADAAVWLVGMSYGVIGMVIAVVVIIGTQRKADAYWQGHNAVTSRSAA
jgi:energy-converting hydrogenase Eha subunit B